MEQRGRGEWGEGYPFSFSTFTTTYALWSVLNEDILKKYANIVRLFSTELMKENNLDKIINYFNIPKPFLCEKVYDLIKSEKKEEISKLNNDKLNEYLEITTRKFAYSLNDSLYPHSDDYPSLKNYVENIIKKQKKININL